MGSGNAQSLRQSCSLESATGAFGSCGTRFMSTTRPHHNAHAIRSGNAQSLNARTEIVLQAALMKKERESL